VGRGVSVLPLASGGADLGAAGQTPVLRVPRSRDPLSVISGITLTGDLFLQLQEDAYDAHGVVGFLQALLDHVRYLTTWRGMSP
jgi:hypothetical protein